MSGFINRVLSAWMWFAIGLAALTGFAIQLLLAFTLLFDRRRLIVGRTLRLAAIWTSRLSPFWSFGILGEVRWRPRGKTVVVCNHESQADPFLISFLPWEMKWLAKAELFKIPLFGWSMLLAGDVPVARGTASSGRDAMERCAEWIDRGVPVMIFPEGTRSTTADLLPFKDGAFRLAIDAQADVLPIAVSGTRRALPKHSWRFSRSVARVTVGEPISTVGMTDADLETLKAKAREQIIALRATLIPVTSSATD